MRIILLLFILLSFSLLNSCSDKIFENETVNSNINGPISMDFLNINGTPFLLLVNSNFDLNQESSTLSLVNIKTLGLVKSDPVKIQNLSMKIRVYEDDGSLFISDKTDFEIKEYTYTPLAAPYFLSIKENFSLETDSNPYDFLRVKGDKGVEKFFVTNSLTGILSILTRDGDNPTAKELTLDSTDYNPFRILAGIGITTLQVTPDKKFLLVAGTNTSLIFVIDIAAEEKEGYISFDPEFEGADSGVRGMAVSTQRNALYFTSTSQKRVLKANLGKISDNKVSDEIITDVVQGSIALSGKDPSFVAISPGEKFLYVLNYDSSDISVIDLDKEIEIKTIKVERGPTEMAIFPAMNYGFVSNFLSDSVSVIDLNTNELIKTIKN